MTSAEPIRDNLRPCAEAVEYMKSYRAWYLEKLLVDHIGPAFAASSSDFPKPTVELLTLHLEGQPQPIYSLDIWDIDQLTNSGNAKGIKKGLIEALGYSMHDLMQGRFLVRGDQLLLDRLRSQQHALEGDMPGENLMFVLPLLGPLHTMMNNKKLIMWHHLGAKDGSTPGSLMAFNKKLRRTQGIDEQAKDLWTCIDITKDAVDSVLLGMYVREAKCENWDAFQANLMSGEADWRKILRKING